jgi:hypothetical protein
MPVDLNDCDALIEHLADALKKAVVKGIRVRDDDNGELTVTCEGVDRVRVLPTGEVQTTAPAPKPPLSSLLRRPGEAEAAAEKRVLGDD